MRRIGYKLLNKASAVSIGYGERLGLALSLPDKSCLFLVFVAELFNVTYTLVHGGDEGCP